MQEKYNVFVKTDETGRIISINSSAFVSSDWGIKIDEGVGDRFHHAQNFYLDGPLLNQDNIPRYKIVDGKPVLRSEEEIAADSMNKLRAAKQEKNKKALADWLAAHPLTWTDGKVYGVTEQDQTEMAINLAQYQLAAAAGQPAVLEWHTQKKSCHIFTLEEYTALSLAIAAYVYPYLRYQESVKEAIYMAETKEELDAIKIDYGSVGAAA